MATLDHDAEQLLRELAPQVLGVVVRKYRDLAACEDAVQEALLAAASQWPVGGTPENPKAWLIQVASRRMTDHVRSEVARRRREAVVASWAGMDAAPVVEVEGDDTLILLFLCCHPSLTQASAIALTLRAVGGLTTAEIARAFLVPESTMAQRISRAKQTIETSGVAFAMPEEAERDSRLKAVMHVLYLIFSEGYTSGEGLDLQRNDLAREAIRLTRVLLELLEGDGDVAGLLALMLLTDARREARTGLNGELIPLAEQDRGLWKQSEIREGVKLLEGAFASGSLSSYTLQAAIAALHDEAARVEETDWAQILALYAMLRRIADSPVVALNQAVAAAMVHGPAVGLEMLEELRLEGHHRLWAVRAHLQELQGDLGAAMENYERAAQLTASMPERNYLLGRAARLRG